MTQRTRWNYAAVAAAILALATVSPHAQNARQMPAAEKPRLVVFISIDQMRGDYVDRFRHQWTKGLHRLVTEGAWFRQTDYPYYNTVTCAGHASMSTGTVPAVHGMVLNQWWERNNSRLVACTDDDDALGRDAAAGFTRPARREHFSQGPLGHQPWRPPSGRGDLAR